MTGQKLRRERIKRMMSQVEFARMLSISQPQLSRYERAGGRLIPAHLTTIRRLAELLAQTNGRTAEGRTSTAR